ncbi:MAG: ABC transporter permease [Clostridia bacterium]|nr:ABC transporter permease [Clostridia bacterium]
MTMFLGGLQEGLFYALLAMGVFISFRILNTPDLTTEGSYTLGVAVSAVLTVAGHPVLGLLCAFLAGAAAGSVTGLLQTKVGIHPILAGILTMSGLYTINTAVMGGRPDVTVPRAETLFSSLYDAFNINLAAFNRDRAAFTMAKELMILAVALVLAGLVLVLLVWFFRTHVGLCIRATGNNEAMVRSSSINAGFMKILGLAIANGCTALAGGVMTQSAGFATISNGAGVLVVGLASVIIGEVIVGKRSVTVGLVSAILGSVVYQCLIRLATSLNMFPAYYLKLVSAVIVAVALALPTIRESLRHRKGGRRHA